jgi:hypothetical protein
VRIAALIPDLIFRSRVIEAARAAGVEAAFVRRVEELPPADLTLIDLNSPSGLAALELPPAGRVIGFVGHLRTDLIERGRSLGWTVLSNGEFVTRLPELLSPGI